jgi:hypothetical protein
MVTCPGSTSMQRSILPIAKINQPENIAAETGENGVNRTGFFKMKYTGR